METKLHAISKCCTKCNAELILGDNWSEGMARNRSYMCRSCNAAKGRAFYVANQNHVIETSKKRRHRDPDRIREYWRDYRAKNPDACKGWHDRYRDRSYESPERRAKRLLAAARSRAKLYGVAFDLTLEWIVAKLEAGICEATGLPFDISVLPPRAERQSRTPAFSPSFDRIERGGGYTQDNVRVVVFIYNVARSDFDDNDLLTLAKALAA